MRAFMNWRIFIKYEPKKTLPLKKVALQEFYLETVW